MFRTAARIATAAALSLAVAAPAASAAGGVQVAVGDLNAKPTPPPVLKYKLENVIVSSVR